MSTWPRSPELYHEWKAEEGLVGGHHHRRSRPQRLQPQPQPLREADNQEDVLPLEEAVVLLREAEEERAEVDKALWVILSKLGLVRRE